MNDWTSGHDIYEQHSFQNFLSSIAPAGDYQIQGINDQYQYQPNNYVQSATSDWANYTHEYTDIQPEFTSSFQNIHITSNQPEIAQLSHDRLNHSKSIGKDGYSPYERLTDTISTLKDMPSKIDRTSKYVAEKFSKTIHDVGTLSSVVDMLVEACLTEIKFLPIAGKFCHYLCRNVQLCFDGVTLCSLLVQNLLQIQSNHEQLIFRNSEKFRMLVKFSTDLYIKFEEEATATDQCNDSNVLRNNGIEIKAYLASLLYRLYKSALSIGKDVENFRTVIDMLLLSGKLLESRDKITTDLGANVNMDSIMFEIDELINNELNSDTPDDLRHLLDELVQIRANNWDVKEDRRPKLFEIEQPTARIERSNAIRIVNPNDNSLVRQTGDSKIDSHGNDVEEPTFTDAELQFMSEEIEASELAAMLKDDNLRMPAEIEEAYEEFLNEQQAILPVVQIKES